MDLLYSLQTIRQACPDWLISAIILLSESTLIVAPLIPFCAYLSDNKKKGTYMLCAFALAYLCNELLKVTVCEYRPWILDDRLTPVAQVLNTATNYSLPSSHSCAITAACTANLLAFPKNAAKTVLTIFFIVLIMFSRMFLGCHSLLDVCVGAGIGVGMAFLLSPMLKETFDEDAFTRWMLPVMTAVTVCAIIYITKKDYPLDYNEDGSLIVDPAKMWPDVMGSIGLFAGVGLGLYIERMCIGFPLPQSKKWAVLRCVISAVIGALLFLVVFKKLFAGLDRPVSKFLCYSITSAIICAGMPALFKLRADRKR